MPADFKSKICVPLNMQKKLLYLVRHAKAEDHSFAKRDHDRDLIDKGRSRAVQIATDLANELEVTTNTLAISSTANRARQTAELFCDTLGYPQEKIQLTKAIYEAFYLDILRTINAVGSDVDTLIVFGHNPGFSDLTNYLTDSFIDLKTSHVAVIELEEGMDFSTLSGSTAKLKNVLT